MEDSATIKGLKKAVLASVTSLTTLCLEFTTWNFRFPLSEDPTYLLVILNHRRNVFQELKLSVLLVVIHESRLPT